MGATNLETRTSILETKVTYIEDKLAGQVEKLEQVCDGVTLVREHIAKQNGALPRIEANTALAATRINQLEDMIYKHTTSDKEEAIKNAKEIAVFGTKQKIMWGAAVFVIGAVITQLLALGAKYLF